MKPIKIVVDNFPRYYSFKLESVISFSNNKISCERISELSYINSFLLASDIKTERILYIQPNISCNYDVEISASCFRRYMLFERNDITYNDAKYMTLDEFCIKRS